MRGSRFQYGLGAVVLAAGCFSIPEYAPENAVTFTAASDTVNGGGMVGGPGFGLRFPDGAGLRFPDGLLIDGVDVMGHDSTQSCVNEDELGFRTRPMARISATGGAPAVKNLLVPALRGPAVVQMKLDWATQFPCNSMRAPGGISTFTVFPDGRIVRHDVLADANDSDLVPITCRCDSTIQGTDLGFAISTFWTFAKGSFMTLHNPGPEALPDAGIESTSNRDTACVDEKDSKYQVAVGWVGVDPQEMLKTTVRGGMGLVEFGRDWVFGDSVLKNFSFESSSAIFIERTGCAAAIKRTSEHTNPSELTINGIPMKPSRRDGMYGGDAGDGSPPGIAAERVVLSGVVNSSFAVWVRFPGSVDGVRATLDGATGAWYLPQRNDDGSWIIWFRDTLKSQTITIEPR